MKIEKSLWTKLQRGGKESSSLALPPPRTTIYHILSVHLTPAQHSTSITVSSSVRTNPTGWAFTFSCHTGGTEKSSHSPKVTKFSAGLVLSAVKLRFPLTIQHRPQNGAHQKVIQTAFQRVTVMVGVLNINWIMLLRMLQSLGRRETLDADAGHFRRSKRQALASACWMCPCTCFFWIVNDSMSVVRCLLFFSRNCTLSPMASWLAGWVFHAFNTCSDYNWLLFKPLFHSLPQRSVHLCFPVSNI